MSFWQQLSDGLNLYVVNLQDFIKLASYNDSILKLIYFEKENYMAELTFNQLFHFTEEDLHQNKLGYLSESQKKRQKTGGVAVFATLTVLGLILALGFYYISKSNGSPSLIGALVVFVILAGTGLFFGLKSLNAAKSEEVHKVTGTVTFVYRRNAYYIIVDNLHLPALVTAKNLFKADVVYDIYYSDDYSIVSVEEKH